MKILGRRIPTRGVSLDLVTGANVLDGVGVPVVAVLSTREPHEGDPATISMLDLLAELVGFGGHLAGDAAGAHRVGDGLRADTILLAVDGHENR